MKTKILIILYWIWGLTWNGLLSFMGIFVTLFALIFKKGKIHKNGYGIITEFGGNWGGLNLGIFSFCGSYSGSDFYEHTRKHEFGHSLQGLIWGPLQLFVIVIPSVCRYWYQRNRDSKGLPNKEYDSIWFEGQATRWGSKAIDNIEGGIN